MVEVGQQRSVWCTGCRRAGQLHELISTAATATIPPSSTPSYHPTILPSYHHTIIPSYHHTILPSYHPTIIPSYHHTILPSYHHTIIPPYHPTILPLYQATKLAAHHHPPGGISWCSHCAARGRDCRNTGTHCPQIVWWTDGPGNHRIPPFDISHQCPTSNIENQLFLTHFMKEKNDQTHLYFPTSYHLFSINRHVAAGRWRWGILNTCTFTIPCTGISAANAISHV